MEKSVSSVASGNSINSKLRYPLRSALRSKEGKPPVPNFSASSVPRRGRVASAVSQSTTVLDLSGKKSVDLEGKTELKIRALELVEEMRTKRADQQSKTKELKKQKKAHERVNAEEYIAVTSSDQPSKKKSKKIRD